MLRRTYCAIQFVYNDARCNWVSCNCFQDIEEEDRYFLEILQLYLHILQQFQISHDLFGDIRLLE